MAENYSLKDELVNESTIKILSDSIKGGVYKDFDDIGFQGGDIMAGVDQFELKERITLIRKHIYKYIALDYDKVCKILLDSIERIEEGKFVFASYPDYVMAYGLSDEHLTLSLEMLGEYTKALSSEFAIRSFINMYPSETYDKMMAWSLSDNVHQRRLASEGFRPKLPWAEKINIDYKLAAEPLNNLFYDSERYVTRSVANHLNDISKMEPKYVIDRLKKWQATKRQDEKEMAYIISHSLRTLVKKR